MAAAVYVLCFLTSLACAVLLLRGFRRSKVRLLLWSGLCFVGIALNNGILFIDQVVVPNVDLYLLRTIPVLAGLLVLLYGMVWEER